MQCGLFLVQLVVILHVHQSQLSAAAAAAKLSPKLPRPMCADATLQDFIEISEACQLAESLGSGAECWANLDAVIQLCLDEAAAVGHLEMTGVADDAISTRVLLTLGAHQTNTAEYRGSHASNARHTAKIRRSTSPRSHGSEPK